MNPQRSIAEYIDVVKGGIDGKFERQKPKKVVIVGAGLAGLSAGYELKRAGHTPVILEAQQRVGGRVYTLREPFTEGLYIRQLHYDASAKILFQCRRRFWEEDDGIFGGGTITDLPIRNLYYPDHGRETGRGVILASYTWSEDAQRWGSLKPEDRIVQALEDVAEIHPQITQEFEVGASWMWHDDEFAGGAFALFDPGQQTLLHDDIIKPEGRIHFAGEHASLYHAWIQGAFESGLRAAIDVHRAP